jgi:ATP-dependent helicase/nuclease subunit A
MVDRGRGAERVMTELPRQIPDDVLVAQRRASDPACSAWVAANAGSGKTHVLAQRVIRLMLRGVEPAKILCLTFTKAAAANMANQVFARLAQWVALDDAALDDAIARIEGDRPDATGRRRARRLFAQALETPGGLKVQTIHAFCARLLHQFPFEADVTARFSVLEEFAQRDLLERLRLEVLLRASAAPETTLGRALAAAITAGADKAFSAAVEDLIEKRDALGAWTERAGGIEAAIVELATTLGTIPGETLESLEHAMVESPNLPAAQWPVVAALLDAGASSEREQAARLRAAATMPNAARAHAYVSVFLTARGEPRNRIVTRAFAAKHRELAERLAAEQARLEPLARKRRAVLARDRTAAAVAIADAVVRRYAQEKQNRGLLDYDDLIEKSLALLGDVEAAWVHYKLDLGIDHVLIDEAQDTSARQWEIIRRLTAEFTAGEGVFGRHRRSIFAVGDEKQSIFSFQGAAPEHFADMARQFAARHRDAALEFRHCKFPFSFRSGSNVLGAVDCVFASPAIFRSITSDADGVPPHVGLPGKVPGLVEIWPPIAAVPTPEIEAWDAPFDEPSQSNPQVKLAERIAATIRILLDRGRSPGDILVLVRQRGALFEAVIRALKNADIAVAGADRLVLTEHIAVMDLLVLADALLQESDDLALATALKSPLFGFDDEQLFALAWNRSGTLRAALRAAADPRASAASIRLDRLAQLSRRAPPFDFYAHVLGREGGRRRFLARLGTETADALDEFLNLALAYETTGAPSLQGFVAFMRAAATEVKRDMDIVRDEVRVMTVHGAKGLEAPVVVLADTTTRPAGPRDPRILSLAAAAAPAGAADCLVWATAKDQDVPVMAAARERARAQAEDEYRRLLYVAMTRTAEHLIVCGAHGTNGKPAGCWYDLVEAALGPNATDEPAIDGDGTVRCWRKVPETTPERADTRHEAEPIEIPAWLGRTLEAAPGAPPSLAPSRAVKPDASIAPARSQQDGKARRRGQLAHRLMQSLPDLLPERRAAAAQGYLDRAAAPWEEAERARLVAEVLAVLGDPRFAVLFAPGTRAEVPIRGCLGRNGRPPLSVSGQVDRLAVTDATILIADYKTDRPAPRRPEEAPPAYVAQLALYRAVLEKIYPGREVRAALLWTDSLGLMELPAAALDAALARVLAA